MEVAPPVPLSEDGARVGMEALLGTLLKIGSVFVCAIPARYRQRWPLRNDADLRGPAIVSGGLEFLIAAPGTLLYCATAMNVAKSGFGIDGLILNPFLPFPFLFAEGGVRLLAALGAGQVLPVLPLQIVAWVEDAMEGRSAREKLGPLSVDSIETGTGNPWDLRILSCRPKPHWNPYMTIRYDGQFFQMLREERTDGPRQFVYLLRKNPATRLVVVVYEYRIEDGLQPDAPPRRWIPS
jgi:hypothetical protein